MGILDPILEPIIRKAVVNAMDNFMEKHWTRLLAGLTLLIVGIAFIMGKADIDAFLIASGVSVGGNALRSVGRDFASKKTEEVKP
jgi:hypothetical protein